MYKDHKLVYKNFIRNETLLIMFIEGNVSKNILWIQKMNKLQTLLSYVMEKVEILYFFNIFKKEELEAKVG